MKSTLSTLLAGATLLLHVKGDSKTWAGWDTGAPSPTPAQPQTVTWENWDTTTVYEDTTYYSTIYITDTVYKTTTDTAIITVTPPQVTITKTIITTQIAPTTITQTEISVSGSISTVQLVNTNTVTNEKTITGIVTSISVATQTVSISYCPPPPTTILTGLVPCPSRIINTDYTPPAPLPTTYLWGCKPGYLCHPKQINCNFESNPPADSYICAPEDCYPTEPIPPINSYLGLENVNDTCAWFTPVDDYFNINPTFFGLDFKIFKTDGQTGCSTSTPPPPPPSSTTVPKTTTTTTSVWQIWTSSSPPPPPPPTYSPTTWQQWTTTKPSPTSTWGEWSSAAPSPASTWGEWSSGKPNSETSWGGWSYSQSVSAPAVVSSAGWGAWPSPSTHVTKRMELVERENVVYAGPDCYAACNVANYVFQSIGEDPALCATDGSFSVALANVKSCTSLHADADQVLTQVPVLASGLSYCSAQSTPTTSTSPALPIVTSTTTITSTSAPVSTSSKPVSTTTSGTGSAASTTTTTSSPATTKPSSSTTTTTGSSTTTTTSSSTTTSIPITTFKGNAINRETPALANSAITFILSILGLFFRI